MERAPLTIERHEDHTGSTTRIEGAVDGRVAALFARPHCGFEERSEGGTWLMTPNASVTIILNLGPAFGGLPDGFVVGMEREASLVERSRTVSCLDLKLTPLGAYRVLGVGMDELAGATVKVDELFGRDGEHLLDDVRSAASWEDRFAVLDAFFVRRAGAGRPPAPQVEHAWRRLVASAGQVPIGALADEVGWSRRHLVDRFRTQVGLPPKLLARVVRFDRLVKRIDREDEVRWADLAAECGYYDQAHLHRDVREFAGTTPADYVNRMRGAGIVVGDPDPEEVNFVQDRSTPAA